VRAETLQRFAEAFREHGFDPRAFRPCYGLAEGSLLIAGSRNPGPRRFDAARLGGGVAEPASPGAPPEQVSTLVSCGPTWGNEAIVVDPETRLPCADGHIGHIWVRGGSVSRSYWNRGRDSGAFEARLAGATGDAWLDTGDLGFVQDGELVVTGRHKELVVIRGRKHHPQDIERTVSASHPALREGDAAAFAIEEQGEEALVVVQAVERSWVSRLAPEQVSLDVNEALGRAHGLRARTVLLVRAGTIPRTSSGKIMRSACRQLFLQGAIAPLAAAAP
jgi:acyl-CoA synthetase (AMP-forming)/AMP-acid ligase II